MYCDSGRWDLGVRYFTSWRSSDSNHHGLLCPASRRRKLHGNREIVGHDGAVINRLWCNRFDQLRDQRSRLRPVGSQRQDFEETCLRTMLGGPQKEKIFCYASGFDQEWYMELGFKATKLFTPYGPVHGKEGLIKLEELVASTREVIGDKVELMLDAWTGFDVEHTVRVCEIMKPYDLKWMEDYISPEDFVGYETLRQRIPWQTLATGEHWYLPTVFAAAAGRRLVDIFQPDVLWCGGITAAAKICHIAEANGISVIAHGGMNYPYGQHLSFAMPAITWGERSEGISPPGVPLEEMVKLPGTPVIKDGYLVPSDAPGFGLEIDEAWIESVSA